MWVICCLAGDKREMCVQENTASTPNGNAPMLTERSERRLIVPSVQSEPDVKPYVKPTQKSNRNIMMNALQYSVFAGAVHDEQRKKVMEVGKNLYCLFV
jgi:hypothetical protein